jgi:hypothetical protein
MDLNQAALGLLVLGSAALLPSFIALLIFLRLIRHA